MWLCPTVVTKLLLFPAYRDGFDKTGYNKYGYDKSGFDKDGFDK